MSSENEEVSLTRTSKRRHEFEQSLLRNSARSTYGTPVNERMMPWVNISISPKSHYVVVVRGGGSGLVPATHLVLDGKPIESQVGSIDIP